eukprot:gene8805-7988_t
MSDAEKEAKDAGEEGEECVKGEGEEDEVQEAEEAEEGEEDAEGEEGQEWEEAVVEDEVNGEGESNKESNPTEEDPLGLGGLLEQPTAETQPVRLCTSCRAGASVMLYTLCIVPATTGIHRVCQGREKTQDDLVRSKTASKDPSASPHERAKARWGLLREDHKA